MSHIRTVSVIIPTYNDGAVLKEAILSVSRSSYPLLEIIVVDDGSQSDDARIIAESLGDKINTPVIYIKKRNGGPSSARNSGLRLANSEWIAFLDADDVMLSDSISSKFKYLNECKCLHDVTGVYGSFIWSTSGVIQPFINSCNAVSRDYIGVLGKVPGGVPAYVLKKEALIQIGGFDESLRFNEDFDFLLRLINAGYGLIGTDEPGFIRNVCEHSLTRINQLESLNGSRVFLKKAYRNNLLSKREILRRLIINYISSLKRMTFVFIGNCIRK